MTTLSHISPIPAPYYSQPVEIVSRGQIFHLLFVVNIMHNERPDP